MKKLLLISLFALFSIANLSAQEKRKSPAKTVEGKIGNLKITINYSSPSVNGREIYGGLVPFDEVWRAGANEATTIEFNQDAMINGMDIKAGTYAFFVTPKEKGNWDIIFNTESKQWGAYKLDQSKNALKSTATTSKIDAKEMLEYSISDEMIHLDWSTTRASFKVK